MTGRKENEVVPVDDAQSRVSGVCAVLGMDVVSFSTLSDEDQLTTVRFLIKWVRAALDFQEIKPHQYHWSPAGDGGYLTFKTPAASERALEVAFSILEKAQHPSWVPRTGNRVELRLGLHAGIVHESDELGGGTNIWGDGINMAARVLSVSVNSQVLVSNQYYENYIRNRATQSYEFGEVYPRTVKHGVRISVRNCRRGDLGLKESDEIKRRWAPIGSIWKKASEGYENLIEDAIDCDDAIAVLAATKFLLELNDDSKRADAKADEIFASIGESGQDRGRKALRHSMFNMMPPVLLRRLIQDAIPRIIGKGQTLCEEGDHADSCYIPVYGSLVVQGTNIPTPIEVPPGQIMGEFSLWVPNSLRTASIVAKEESMLLEVPNSLFVSICEQSTDMAARIYLLIRRRLLENAVKSKHFFPGIPALEVERLLNQPSIVEKHPAGARLNLRDATYVLFDGVVRIFPEILGRANFDVEARGHFNINAVAGIASQSGDLIDGEEAEIVEECVTIRFPHKIIFDLYKYPEVQTAWDGVWGRRTQTLLRSKGHGNQNGQSPAAKPRVKGDQVEEAVPGARKPPTKGRGAGKVASHE
jgi:class 3 adenylate cyclase